MLITLPHKERTVHFHVTCKYWLSYLCRVLFYLGCYYRNFLFPWEKLDNSFLYCCVLWNFYVKLILCVLTDVSFVSESPSCSLGGFTVTCVYLTVRYQLHVINALATCSSPNGCNSLAGYLICNVFDLCCVARTPFEKPAYIIVISWKMIKVERPVSHYRFFPHILRFYLTNINWRWMCLVD